MKKQIIGYLGVIIFLTTIIFSILNYNNYSFFGQNFSDLGFSSNGMIFNFGVMLTSIILLIYFYFQFLKNNKLLFLSFLSGIGLFGVGLFPLTYPNLHYYSAGLFFTSSFLLILLNIFYFKKNKLENNISKKVNHKKINKKNFIFKIELSYFFYFSVLVLLLIIIYSIFQNPLLQKLSVFSIIFWHLFYLLKY